LSSNVEPTIWARLRFEVKNLLRRVISYLWLSFVKSIVDVYVYMCIYIIISTYMHKYLYIYEFIHIHIYYVSMHMWHGRLIVKIFSCQRKYCNPIKTIISTSTIISTRHWKLQILFLWFVILSVSSILLYWSTILFGLETGSQVSKAIRLILTRTYLSPQYLISIIFNILSYTLSFPFVCLKNNRTF
jgi:hypothetical protein